MTEKICFPKERFNQTIGLIIIVVIIIFVFFTYYYTVQEKISKSKMRNQKNSNLQNEIKQLKDLNYELNVSNDRCNQNVFLLSQRNKEMGYDRRDIYGGDSMGATRKYINPNATGSDINYRQVGFLYDGFTRYTLFGRYLYQGRTDLWEYYIVDDSRNRVRIPFKSPNNKEIFNGDVVNVPSVGDLQANIYDIEQYKYSG